jgi:hypothetical protein
MPEVIVLAPSAFRPGTGRLRPSWFQVDTTGKMRAAAVILLLVGGCEAFHKPESTSFRAVDGGFKFRAIADAAYPEASANGEAWRMRWLEQRLAANGVCPDGYIITSRETELLSSGALGSIYDVYYEGRCTRPD